MKVGFYHAGDSSTHLQLAQILIASVRRCMPDVEIVHFTDDQTPAIAGVDATRVRPHGPIALAVLEAYSECAGDWLLVDTDIVVQRDVRHVFDDTSFAIAVADRDGTLRPKEVGTKFMASMPYNKGAVYSRSAAFWKAAAEQLRLWPASQQAWMGDQKAMCAIIKTGRFPVRILPSSYNYPPLRRDEDLSDKAVLHFKGPRKAWILEAA